MSKGWLARTGAVAALCLLANCGGEAGFDPEIQRVFFGLNGDGACNRLAVEVDLEGSLLNHPSWRTIDCVISTDLRFDGCTADFEESDDGLTLFATISGCRIPSTSELFHCGFFSIDDALAEASAQCSCANAGCDRTPPLCVDGDQDPDSCEDCDNGIDDDSDGDADCRDANCEHSPVCGDTTTTSTTSTSSTTSTTIPVTTTLPPPTTTLPPTTSTTTTTVGETTTTSIVMDPGAYSVVFRLTSASDSLGALQWSTNYGSAPGEFRGSGAAVVCTNLVSGALFAPNDNDAASKLTLGLIALSPFSAPTDLVRCTFDPTAVPTPADFPVTVEDSTNGDGAPATASIGVTVEPLP